MQILRLLLPPQNLLCELLRRYIAHYVQHTHIYTRTQVRAGTVLLLKLFFRPFQGGGGGSWTAGKFFKARRKVAARKRPERERNLYCFFSMKKFLTKRKDVCVQRTIGKERASPVSPASALNKEEEDMRLIFCQGIQEPPSSLGGNANFSLTDVPEKCGRSDIRGER